MLEELHVRDLALIEDVWLEFTGGLTALTGETGAGKTALVGAVQLLVGERADSQMVRAGAPEALVEGRVRDGETEIVARRRVTADGRSRCQIDGAMATVGSLATTLGPRFDLHGQHEHQALLRPANHVAYLDRYIGRAAADALAAYRGARDAYLDASDSLARLEVVLAEDVARADYLRFVVDEIDAVAPQPDEDVEIESRLPGMQHGERLTEAAGEAFAALNDEGGVRDALTVAVAALGRVAGLDPRLDALAERLSEAEAALVDTAGELRDYGEGIEHDPSALNAAHARLAAIGTLKKKYGPDLGAVFHTRDDARERLDNLDLGDEARTRAENQVADARRSLVEAADALAGVRRGATERFVSELSEQTAELAMESGRFGVELSELEFDSWTDDGPHRVEFVYAPGQDQPFRPLGKIASGGEVSRVMLALKSVLGPADDVPVLVFDEVDAGIGGATALAVGRKLAALARDRQVIVITHLAQVAAFADQHIVVDKRVVDGGIATSVRTVAGVERVDEVARMLSGGDSEASRAHAEELLRAAAG